MGKKTRQVDIDLFAACSAGDAAKAAKLLASDADAKYKDETYGYTSLHVAADGGHIECVRHLLGGTAPGDAPPGGNPVTDARDEHGQTPLMLACYNGHANVVSFLLAAGAEPRLGANDGTTAAKVAANEDFDDLAELLEKKIADLREAERKQWHAEEAEAERMERKQGGISGSGGGEHPPPSAQTEQPELVQPPALEVPSAAIYSALAAALVPEGRGLGESPELDLSPGRMDSLHKLGADLARVLSQVRGLGTPEERLYVLTNAAMEADN